MIKVLLASLMLSTIQVYRLERDTETEQLHVVGIDGVRRACCIIDPDQYAVLTGQVAQVWQSMHKTEDGRVKLHGRRKEQVIEGSEKTTYYEDGYRFTEKMEVRRTHTSDNVVRTNGVRSAIMPTRKPTNISDRQWKMRQMIEARKKSKGKTVTVEHNAATGKDTVK